MKENEQNRTEEVLTPDEIEANISRKMQKEKKVERTVFTVFLALVLAAVCFCAGWFGRYAALGKRNQSLLWAIETAEKNYYKDIDEDALYEKLFSAFEFDPYSCYYTATEYGAVEDVRNGNNKGYGFSMFEEDGLPKFFHVLENSPACLAELKKGMYVLGFSKEDGNFTKGSVAEFFDFIDGADGSFFIRAGYEKDGSDAKSYLLMASNYTAAYCSYRDSETSFSFRGEKADRLDDTFEPLAGLDEKTAYIRLDEFNGNAAEEFRQCLVKMKARGRENLVLDLRSNGGGYMDILLEIASHIMKEAPSSRALVASAKFKNGSTYNYSATNNDYSSYFSSDSHVTVLADEYTASASECLIGALVDYGTIDFSDIVLRKDETTGIAKSYGKGIMQSHFQDNQGNVLKLTVAEIFWPKGKTIHGIGVTEADGAKSVVAPFVWGAEDVLLTAVLDSLHGASL